MELSCSFFFNLNPPGGSHELGSNGRQLETVQRQGQGAVGQAHRRPADVINGRRDQLSGKIQETYGLSKDEAERQLKEWESRTN